MGDHMGERLEQKRHEIRTVLSLDAKHPSLTEMRTLPHGWIVFALQFGPPLGSEERAGVTWCRDTLTGIRSEPIKYFVQPGTRALVALLSPRAACSLLDGMPLAHCADMRIPLDAIFTRAVRQELEDLAPEPTPEAARAVSRWLFQRCQAGRARLSAEAQRTFLLAELARDPAVNSLQALERHVNVSRRQCQRDFLRWIGIPPKQLLELHRVQRTLRLIRQRSALSTSALQEGYADQAHMTRTIKRITGLTPRAWSNLALSDVGASYAHATRDELITI